MTGVGCYVELHIATPMCRSQLCAGRRLDVFRLGAARPLANRSSTHSFGTGGRVLVAKSLRWIGIEVVGARPTGSAGDQDTLTVPCV